MVEQRLPDGVADLAVADLSDEGVDVADEVEAALGSRLSDAAPVERVEEADAVNAGPDERHDDVIVLVALVHVDRLHRDPDLRLDAELLLGLAECLSQNFRLAEISSEDGDGLGLDAAFEEEDGQRYDHVSLLLVRLGPAART